MDREQLLTSILAADPQPGDLVYVQRQGDSYSWHPAGDADQPPTHESADSWIYYCWQRVLGDPGEGQAMLEDLLAEMESMTGAGPDRCRWPLDQPWPLRH